MIFDREQISVFLYTVGIVIYLVFSVGCKEDEKMEKEFIEIQLTTSPYGHTLNSTQVFSKSNQWIVYDTRNYDTAIASTCCIEMVHAKTGKVVPLYATKKQSEYGPGVGAATFSPIQDTVLFIHGIRNADRKSSYSITRRTGVAIDIKKPNQPIFMDARDVSKPYVKGALRGGTHAHTWSGDGQWISFTYNDEIMEQLAKTDTAVRDMRTVGIMMPRPVRVDHPNDSLENYSGTMFSVVIADVTEHPKRGSDEIDRAFDETWIGKNGYINSDGERQERAIAFQGNVKDKNGHIKTEVFVADLPSDPTHSRLGELLTGTDSTRPAVPEGVQQRRITYTDQGLEGPRFWLRTTPDGSLIAFLMKDGKGIIQLFGVSPNGGEIQQITFNDFSIQNPFNISPDGKKIAFVGDNSVFVVGIKDHSVRRLTKKFSDEEKPIGAPNWANDGQAIAYNRYVHGTEEDFLQIFLLREK